MKKRKGKLRSDRAKFRLGLLDQYRTTSEADLTRLTLEYCVGMHKALAETYLEREAGRKPGKPPGETFKGQLTHDAIDYAQQVKRQMKAAGIKSLNREAAKKAAADLLEHDPCYANYKILKRTIYWGLRNNR